MKRLTLLILYVFMVSATCRAQYNVYSDYDTNYYGISKDNRGENGVICGMKAEEYLRDCEKLKGRGICEITFGGIGVTGGISLITIGCSDNLMDTFELEDGFRVIGLSVGGVLTGVGIGLLVAGIIDKSEAEKRIKDCYLGLSRKGLGFELTF